MLGRPMVVRRRPLLRAAAVGGTFAAGRAMGRRSEQQAYAEDSQDQRISSLEQQQQEQAPAQQPQAPAGGGSPVLDQLGQLTALHDQGALTDDEFAAAKAKILGG
jgi:membrane protease subunit (stomatin/prohibitin family)